MGIGTLLIANRGEIAVRIIRAARELGICTVQAHSQADADSLAVRLADRAIDIGPPQAAKSYLDGEAILRAAKESGADAIHPGYGFLAENADFADAVDDAGLNFVGPTGESIRLLGDKVTARGLAATLGVPTVPGSDGRIDDLDSARSIVDRIGFPIMIKAAAGGGGRGIRVVTDQAEFDHRLPQASAEAKAAFGDGGLYFERFIENARHVEVQVLGDGDHVVHCYERECSLQRRRQKVWEEAPAAMLPDDVRTALCKSAVAIARHVGYRGAGTLEYLYDELSGEFHFIEMNTRIQVEHPVTECVTGIDIVREMLRIAGGEPLRWRQDDIRITGHAIECRINAEDPANNFMPSVGVVDGLSVPGGPGVRFDTMLYPGYAVPPFYDSLLGKLIVWDETRSSALKRLERALAELEISGIKTTKPLHQALVAEETVRGSTFDTNFLEHWLESGPPSLVE
ncbi:MAG: acetyl-CoA carboxylase biotin carboxylase subunit [Alphaproteobacteria bacterium]|nr:acetyl-CoA carboxylase biotin carboxylase subunit [Alphaproteobacteria bacterium]